MFGVKQLRVQLNREQEVLETAIDRQAEMSWNDSAHLHNIIVQLQDRLYSLETYLGVKYIRPSYKHIRKTKKRGTR